MSEPTQVAGAASGVQAADPRGDESLRSPAVIPVVFHELPTSQAKRALDDGRWSEVPLSEEVLIPPEKVQLGLWAPTDYPNDVSMVLVLQATDSSKVYVARLINQAGLGSSIDLARIRIAPSEGNAQHTQLWFQWLAGGERNLDALRYCVIGVAGRDGVILRWIALHKGLLRTSLGAEHDIARWEYEAFKLEAPLSQCEPRGTIAAFRFRAGDRIVEVKRPADRLSLLPDSKSKDIPLRFDPQDAMEEVKTRDVSEVKLRDLPAVDVGIDGDQQGQSVVRVRKLSQGALGLLVRQFTKAGQGLLNALGVADAGSNKLSVGRYLEGGEEPQLTEIRKGVDMSMPSDEIKNVKAGLDRWNAEKAALLKRIDDCDAQLRQDSAVVRQFQKDCRNAVVDTFVLSRSLRECTADGNGRVGELLLINVENGQDQPLQFRLLDEGGAAK